MTTLHTMTHFVLRTTDAPAARAFYASLLGHADSPIVPLHESALARGARPHWLGQIEVEEVERTLRAFIEKGAQALGPVGIFPPAPGSSSSEGRRFAVLRDPGGAIVGLTSPAAHVERKLAVWHQLNTSDFARAIDAYASLFGWHAGPAAVHPEHGAFAPFAWSQAGEEVGSIHDIEGQPGRHPHWLFHLRVPDLDAAMACVRAHGGKVLGPFALPSKERLAVCDDPQGAAFALRG